MAVIMTLSRTFSRGANRVLVRRAPHARRHRYPVHTAARPLVPVSIPVTSQGVRSRHAQCCSTTQGRDHEAFSEGGTAAACRSEEGVGAVPAPHRRAEAADQQPPATAIGSSGPRTQARVRVADGDGCDADTIRAEGSSLPSGPSRPLRGGVRTACWRERPDHLQLGARNFDSPRGAAGFARSDPQPWQGRGAHPAGGNELPRREAYPEESEMSGAASLFGLETRSDAS